MKIDYNTLKNADIESIIRLKQLLESWHETWQDSNYVEVTILNRNGNITKQIKEKFPSFSVWWNPSQSGCGIGENIVLIPKSEWNEDIKAAISKFDDFVGHHVEKRIEFEVKDDVKLPYDLECNVNRKKQLLKNSSNKVRFTKWELSNNYNWWHEKDKYFTEVEVITNEWDDELWVRDRTEFSSFDKFRDISVEL